MSINFSQQNKQDDPQQENAEVCKDDQMENKIKFPRSSCNSNSNDISKLNSSFLCSIDSDKRNKISIRKDKQGINMMNQSNEIDSISNGENSEDKKNSNSFYDKIIFDEINKAEKLNGLNGW